MKKEYNLRWSSLCSYFGEISYWRVFLLSKSFTWTLGPIEPPIQ